MPAHPADHHTEGDGYYAWTPVHHAECDGDDPELRSVTSPANIPFEIVSGFEPTGDQPAAIARLTESLFAGNKHQILEGVTGSERPSRWPT